MEQYNLYVGGSHVPPSRDEWFESVNPFSGEAWALIARGDSRDVDLAVAAAADAFRSPAWQGLSATARGALLYRLGDLVTENVEMLALAELRDNGKAIREMRNSIRTMADWFRYYGGLADKVEGQAIPVARPQMLNYTRYEPYGVVAAILPWNSPLRLAAWKIAPALAAGNTMVIKPSEYTSTSIFALMRLMEEAGFPPGVVNVVTGFGPEVAAPLVTHPGVAKVSFTGGESTGRILAELAGRHLKPITLELGGKSPNIVFEDADPEYAARGLAAGIFGSAGQTCLAGSRAFIHSSVYDAVIERLVQLAEGIRMGDPMDEGTDVGPVATDAQFKKVVDFIASARAEGARVVYGGNAVRIERGQFIEPTILVDVDNSMQAAQEEAFGPVLAVIRFESEDELIRMANDVRFGLAAGVWTSDVARAHRVAAKLEAGTVWINTYRITTPQSPFGGVKNSGFGRENGSQMIREYLQVKSVWVDYSGDFPSPF